MQTIAVANTKGGSGKTTVSTHIAAKLARDGRTVAFADLDKQRCAARWVALRPEALPRIHVIDLPDDPRDVKKKFDALVIDVPAGLKKERIEEIVMFAQSIVVPVMPSAFDEVGTEHFLARLTELKPVRKGKRGVATVGNRVRPRTRAATRLATFLAGLQFPPVATLRDAAIYAEAAASGVTLFDLPEKKSRSLMPDWLPLLAFLDEA